MRDRKKSEIEIIHRQEIENGKITEDSYVLRIQRFFNSGEPHFMDSDSMSLSVDEFKALKAKLIEYHVC